MLELEGGSFSGHRNSGFLDGNFSRCLQCVQCCVIGHEFFGFCRIGVNFKEVYRLLPFGLAGYCSVICRRFDISVKTFLSGYDVGNWIFRVFSTTRAPIFRIRFCIVLNRALAHAVP